MSNPNNATDEPQKKYWWLILIALPIVLAMIAVIPNLLKKEESKHTADTAAPIMTQKAENVEQTAEKGHNFTNVQGDINITESSSKDAKAP